MMNRRGFRISLLALLQLVIAVSIGTSLLLNHLAVPAPALQTVTFSKNFLLLPRVAVPMENDHFGACLLVKDDNHRLPEWLAYHYYALPLRRLIVAVDPTSETSPVPILKKWAETLPNLTIAVWDDEDYLIKPLVAADLTHRHRKRQNLFYKACGRYGKAHGWTWTTFIDTDEYLSMNHDELPSAEQRLARPNHMLQLVKDLMATDNDEDALELGLSHVDWYEPDGICFPIPKRRYSAVESNATTVGKGVPPGLNGTKLSTMRFRMASYRRGKADGAAKSILNVSALPDEIWNDHRVKGSAHRPFYKVCPDNWVQDWLPLVIRHYLGSWEAFGNRDDPRRQNGTAYSMWLDRGSLRNGGTDDHIRPWLQSFCQQVGIEVAKELLQGAMA